MHMNRCKTLGVQLTLKTLTIMTVINNNCKDTIAYSTWQSIDQSENSEKQVVPPPPPPLIVSDAKQIMCGNGLE